MDDLLQIFAAVAAVQLVLAAYREWRAARRIVPVGVLDVESYEAYGCVPTQFAGSRYFVVRAVLALWGFFVVSPKSPKQVFAVCGIVGVRDGELVDYRELAPRDHLMVMLDEGEYPKAFDRSMRRGVISFYRTIAVREMSNAEAGEYAHCVTVRAQGMLIRVGGKEGALWMAFEVTSPSPRSNGRSGRLALSDLPEDVVELAVVPSDTYMGVREAVTEQCGGRLRQRLLRHNPNIWVALGHVMAKFAIPIAILIALGAATLGWTATAALLYAVVLMVAAFLYMAAVLAVSMVIRASVRKRLRIRDAGTDPNRFDEAAPRVERLPLRYAEFTAPHAWTGATAHSMSAGRRAKATDARSTLGHAWEQYSYKILPKRR